MAPLSAEVIPVDPEGLPTLSQRCHGTAILVAPDRVLLNLDSRPEMPALVVGVRTEHDALQYFGIDVESTGHLRPGQFLIHGQVGGLADALLQPKNLTPRFHFDTMTFTFGFAAPVLHRWEAAGVLQSVVIDRLLLCPRCHGLPTFRHGCGRCGSGRVHRSSPDHTGADPYHSTPCPCSDHASPTVKVASASRFTYRCQDCQGTEVELAPVNQCLHCNHRFAVQEGYELVLRGYRVDRLDSAAVNGHTV